MSRHDGALYDDTLSRGLHAGAEVRVGAAEGGSRANQIAAEFDPQPFHLNEEAARGSLFKGLAASGWHTAAMTMRLLVESELKPAGGIVGVGLDEFRWPSPVRPDDILRLEI